MTIFLRDRTNTHLVRHDDDRPAIPPVTDVAWSLLWDVEDADYGSPGCAEHRDPACLCDVDVSKTADVVYDRAPDELLEVETLEDLLSLSARMLLHQHFAHELGSRQYTPDRQGDDLITRYRRGCNGKHFAAVLEYVIRNKDATFEDAFRALGVPDDERPDKNALGFARGLVYPKTARDTNRRLESMHERIVQMADEGLSAGGVRKRLAREGHNFKYDSVYHHMLRSRLLPHQRKAAAAA